MLKQVAAIPYRRTPAGGIEVLLITSRDTGRWVIPKGHLMPGRTRAAAAQQEAYEEAGLIGTICPVPVGSYRYVKRRRDGSGRPAKVKVYPLPVERQLSDWPERRQRRFGWFPAEQAARLVAEPELGALIAAFSDPTRARPWRDRLLQAREQVWESITVVRWFRKLLPSEGQFFELFERHAATLVDGAEALGRLLQGGSDMAAHVQTIHDREHDADDIARDTLQDVHRILVTPFDRSAITDLISSMDDAIDQMNSVAKTTTLYEVSEFPQEMRDMAGIIVESARLTASAMPLLRSIGTNATRLNELTARIIRLEGEADDIHDRGMKALFKSTEPGDAMRFIIGRELYGSLEKVVDRFEDVANEIQALVIDHA